MTRKGQNRFLGGEVPKLGGLVAAGGGQTLAVRREGDAEHPVGVVLDRRQFLDLGIAAAEIPDVDQTIAAARGQFLAVGD